MRVSRDDLKKPKAETTDDTRSWADQAREVIQSVHDGLPRDCSLEDRTAAIDAAFPFGRRAHYPYKVWCKERRSYLDKFGSVAPKAAPRRTVVTKGYRS